MFDITTFGIYGFLWAAVVFTCSLAVLKDEGVIRQWSMDTRLAIYLPLYCLFVLGTLMASPETTFQEAYREFSPVFFSIWVASSLLVHEMMEFEHVETKVSVS